LLLASNRPAIKAFFANGQTEGLFEVCQLPVTSEPEGEYGEQIHRAELMVLDAAPDPVGAVQICRYVHARRSSLPIAALFCCPEQVAVWQLNAMISAGATSLLDLQASSEDLLLAFRDIARGDVVLHLKSSTGSGSLLQSIVSRQHGERNAPSILSNDLDIRLLRLVAHGMSDQEVGATLHLSPFTVRHHIERLRREVNARNRIELAAWAGRNGFCQFPESVVPSERFDTAS